MLKGFKDFLLRGNVIDLAVAVIMGAAFGAIVTSVTDKILKPLINAITPPSSPGFGISLVSGKPSTFIDFASVITTTINFVMVALVVYFAIVMPMRALQRRRKRGEESGPAEPTDVEVLKEIRDLLRVQLNSNGTSSATTAAAGVLAGGTQSHHPQADVAAPAGPAAGRGPAAAPVDGRASARDRGDEPELFTQPHASAPPPRRGQGPSDDPSTSRMSEGEGDESMAVHPVESVIDKPMNAVEEQGGGTRGGRSVGRVGGQSSGQPPGGQLGGQPGSGRHAAPRQPE